jgi:homoserine dehydrogenase
MLPGPFIIDFVSAISPPRTIRVGFLGFGTVGTGAYRMLQDNREAISRKVGCGIELAKIGIRDADKPRLLPADQFTTDLESVVDDPSIDVILELIGGIEPAGRLVERALKNGKHVVTANKELIAKDGARLLKMAHERGLDLHYEAAVGGGIPLVQPLKHQLAGNDVLKMMGILNGTTNYILTKMGEEEADLDTVLKEAQAKGYAEADPSADVDGFDAAYKIAILASIAFGKQVADDEVYREGIRNVSLTDMNYANVLGFKIKLLGIVEPVSQDKIRVRVHPTLIPKEHPLASVSDVYNAVWIHGDFVGDVMFSGRGAGSDPTASAVVGDLIDVGRTIAKGAEGSVIVYEPGMETEPIDTLRTCFYVRLVVSDKPRVLGQIATVFGEYDVNLSAMEMRGIDSANDVGEIVFLTHPCIESDFRKSLRDIQAKGIVMQVANSIRLER